jgi:vesicle coat complex subunit
VTLERAAERCINVLLELIQTKVNYVVQEAIVVIKDVFRRYPNRQASPPQRPPSHPQRGKHYTGQHAVACTSVYPWHAFHCCLRELSASLLAGLSVCRELRYESIISTLCDSLDTLDEPEAKASMIWIIGEYAERIDNADELLEQFLETFPEESSLVQLQLVTATVKLFLKKPTEKPQQMIQLVLTYATQVRHSPAALFWGVGSLSSRCLIPCFWNWRWDFRGLPRSAGLDHRAERRVPASGRPVPLPLRAAVSVVQSERCIHRHA